MTFKQRMQYSLVSWFTAALVYIGCGAMNSKPWEIPETLIDKAIPFHASGIWLYLSFYIVIPYAFFTVNSKALKCLSFSFILVSVLSGCIFIFLPSTIGYPEFAMDTSSARLLAFVCRNDTDQNCFPSLHASFIALCAFSLLQGARLVRRLFVILFTLVIFYSIIQVRRHVFIDLAGGFILAAIIWSLCVHQLRERGQ